MKGELINSPLTFNPKILQEEGRLETLAIDKNKILEIMMFK
jgi:hypothetical protein